MKNFFKNVLKSFNIVITKKSSFDSIILTNKLSKYSKVIELIKDKNLKLFKFIHKAKSQIGQELFVLNYLDLKKKGFFVEIGAGDGVFNSNTWLLEKEFEWKGILCEPIKIHKKSLIKNRNCFVENKFIFKFDNKKIYFKQTLDNQYSTILEYVNSDKLKNQRKKGIKYTVETIKINTLLKKFRCPRKFDYLSIDTEGSEYEILSSLDFKRFKPRIITVEHNYNKLYREKIKYLLNKNNYKRVYYDFWPNSFQDDFYINEII